MKNNTFLKGLFMTIVALLATTYTTTGIPSSATGWEILSITVVGTALIYLAKNAVMPSLSLFGTINLRDLGSGLILAIGTGISNWAAAAITSTHVDWHSLLSLMGSVAAGYLAKNFIQKEHPSIQSTVIPTT